MNHLELAKDGTLRVSADFTSMLRRIEADAIAAHRAHLGGYCFDCCEEVVA